jgi:outer membrane lipoprotein-sorting protein
MNKLLTFLLLIGPWFASSQEKSLPEEEIKLLKQGVAESAIKTQTISSDFIQEKEMLVLNEKIVSRGKFYLKQDKKLRWEYTYPFSYVIVISGERITIGEEGDIRSFDSRSNKVFAEINRIIIGSVQGTLLNDETSFRASFSKDTEHYVVTLFPLLPQLKESLEKIVIRFNRNDFTVDNLDLFEPGGDRTKIHFSTKRINQPVADEMFILR